MEFIRKNFVTILVVGATIVLAGVAIFTALRLYNLRQNPVTPVRPASTPGAADNPVGIRPKSGNWNLPESFIVTNITEDDLEITWHIDCWDETVCEDSQGVETLSSGQVFEKGLSLICSQWQLDLNWSGTATEANDEWNWAGVSELGPECDYEIPVDEDEEETTDEVVEEIIPTGNIGDYEIAQCTGFSFTIGGAVVTTSATPTPRVASTPPTATPKVSTTASATPRPIGSATPTPQLPDAGVGTPTILGIGMGAIMLVLAIALAL